MTFDLIILKAEELNAPAIHQLIKEVLGGYNLYHLRPSNVDDDINDLNGQYFNNGGYFWIIKNGSEKIIASAAIYKIDAGTCELRKMYLLKQEQGKGIGKLLLQTAIGKAKELGFAKMVLKTNSKLNTAIGLYKKYGFIFYDISEKDKKEDCDVAMQLQL